MTARTITCALVDEEDLDQRYLAGTLPPEQAEAFEEHYFGCERCWERVQYGLAVRAADRGPAAGDVILPARQPGRRWWGLAAAAAVVLIAVGVARRFGSTEGNEVVRGRGDSLPARALARSDSLGVSWTRMPAAERYRVRLQTSDGGLLLERETPETSLVVGPGVIAAPPGGGIGYWSVEALDSLEVPIAHSELVRQPLPQGSR
jgi:hypothetical protein